MKTLPQLLVHGILYLQEKQKTPFRTQLPLKISRTDSFPFLISELIHLCKTVSLRVNTVRFAKFY